MSRWVFVLSVVLGLGACAPMYYPPAAAAPLFDDEGLVSATVGGGLTDLHGEVAVAATSNVVVVASGATAPRSGQDSSWHAEGSFGAGYFLPFGIGRFEALGGLAGGYASTYHRPFCWGGFNCPSPWRVSGNFVRPWSQATIGLSTDIVDAALVNRFSYVWLKPNASSDYTNVRDGFFYEPTAVLRLGYRAIKGELQAGVSLPMAQTSGTLIEHVPFTVSLGLRIAWDFWGEEEDHAPGGEG